MKIIDILIIITFFYLLVVVLFLFKKKKRLTLHERKINTGEKVLEKLHSIEFNGAKINYLRKVNPFVFEELILSAFKKKGYKIKRNKRYTGDGGIDGIVYDKDNLSYLIQCKRYSSYVNKQDIIEFDRLIKRKNFDGGFFVHTGKTSNNSLIEYKQTNLTILSGDRLINLITNNNLKSL